MPAAKSSSITPAPPRTRRSIKLAGNGLIISKKRKSAKPAASVSQPVTKKAVGQPKRVRTDMRAHVEHRRAGPRITVEEGADVWLIQVGPHARQSAMQLDTAATRQFGVDPQWAPQSASVQSVADRLNPFGTWLPEPESPSNP